MDRSRYPKNWNAIALQVKSEANWRCQDCDRPCRQPGESLEDFLDRHSDLDCDSPNDLYEQDDSEFGYTLKPGRFILTVAHLNHDPSDNSPGNLRALCSVCHLKYDASHHARSRRRNRRAKQEADGQLSLSLDA